MLSISILGNLHIFIIKNGIPQFNVSKLKKKNQQTFAEYWHHECLYINVQTSIYFLLLLGKRFRLKTGNICLNIINTLGGIDLTKYLKKGGGRKNCWKVGRSLNRGIL